MTREGYLVRFYGGLEGFARTPNDLKLLVEAIIESPFYRLEQGQIVPILQILDEIIGTILYTQVAYLGAYKQVGVPLEDWMSLRELFTFDLSVKGDNVSIKVKRRRNKLPPKTKR